jgi:hypothetical protein
MNVNFELLDTYAKESHWWRYLLKCRECGQLYFFEFDEDIDWDEGNDPQYSIYIPVESDDQIAMLKDTSPLQLLRFFPRLQKVFPKDAEAPSAHWVVN